MKKFECEVTRTDKYIIEIDDEKLDAEWMREFRESIYDFHTYKDHAEHIAQFRARFGEGHMDGYGYPYVNGQQPYSVEEIHHEPAVNIKIVSEDDDCDVWVTEL